MILQLEGVSKRFGGLQAVRDVTLAVRSGTRMALLGPNGAGKTTLFHLISGEIKLTTGKISLFGKDVTRTPPHRRAAMGMRRTYQITNLFPNLSVRDHILLALQADSRQKFNCISPLRKNRALVQEAEAILDQANLARRLHDPVALLSYGEQRELEIALALAGKPRLLLLDEPLAGLSPAENERIVDVIAGISSSVTIVFVEHDLDAAFRLAKEVVLLHQGAVVAHGLPEEVRRDARAQEVYLGPMGEVGSPE